MLAKTFIFDKKIVAPDSSLENLNSLRSEGQTVMFVGIDGVFAGLIGVADSIKDSAKAAVEELHRQNIEVIMMTDDNSKTAETVAKSSNI